MAAPDDPRLPDGATALALLQIPGVPAAVAAVKALILSCTTDSDLQVMEAAAASLVRLLRGPAAPAGMTAFLDKRPPPWAPEADIRPGSVAEQDDGRERP